MPPCPGSGVHTAAIHLAKAVGRFQRSAIDQSAAIARGRHPSRPPLASSHWELFGISICPSAPAQVARSSRLAAAAPPLESRGPVSDTAAEVLCPSGPPRLWEAGSATGEAKHTTAVLDSE
jgi:hypothetical protein